MKRIELTASVTDENLNKKIEECKKFLKEDKPVKIVFTLRKGLDKLVDLTILNARKPQLTTLMEGMKEFAKIELDGKLINREYTIVLKPLKL